LLRLLTLPSPHRQAATGSECDLGRHPANLNASPGRDSGCSLRGPSQPAGRTRLVSARLPLRVASDADSGRGQFQRPSELEVQVHVLHWHHPPGPAIRHWQLSHWHGAHGSHWHQLAHLGHVGQHEANVTPGPTRPRPGPKSGSMRDTRQLGLPSESPGPARGPSVGYRHTTGI
jgi:hypothetical protein